MKLCRKLDRSNSTQASIKLGQRVYLELAHELLINTIGHHKDHQCNPDIGSNLDNITYKKIANENEMKYGCSVPFHPLIYSELTKAKIKICDNHTTGLKAYEEWKKLKSKDDIFGTPCAGFDFFPRLPDIDEDDNDKTEAYVQFYLKAKIKVKSMFIYYDFTSCAAEIGGFIGMFLGVSLIDLASMLNSVILKLVHKKIDF